MRSGGSQQQRKFRRAIRDGSTLATACVMSGMGMIEAKLLANEDLKNPPPPEAFELLAIRTPPEETDMARAARKPREVRIEEVHKPDYDLAVRIYRGDIKPAISKVGEHAQELSTAYKAIKKHAHIQPQAAKLAFKLDDMEESKRDDFLRSLNGLLKRLNIFMPADLVDQAQGAEAGEVIPTGERRRPQLVTVDHPADSSDLAQAAE